MAPPIHTCVSLTEDLRALGVRPGDGLFVHASMKAIGTVVGGARSVVQAVLDAVGPDGLVGMPGFSNDAVFPAGIDQATLDDATRARIEAAVPGFDPYLSPTAGMGVLAETFRTWPGTGRSDHPNVSVCLNGADAAAYLAEHSFAWATGPDTPLGALRDRADMKMLLIGVGWNRCTVLHTAETLAEHRRLKTRRAKVHGVWQEAPDVADDVNRLFPAVGAAFEGTGAVTDGVFGSAAVRLCAYAPLVQFASAWIDRANAESGDVA